MEMQMEFIRKLPSPQELMQDYPLGAEASAAKTARDKEIRDIISGKDDRFILVIGPCSADNEDAVLDYIHRLAGVQEKVKDKLMLIPRVYTNKPRTIGVGYKGMLHQANPEGKEDMLAGITAIRKMHVRVVQETGLTSAEEILYPENGKSPLPFRHFILCSYRRPFRGRPAAPDDRQRRGHSRRHEKPHRRRYRCYDEFD